MKLKSVSIENFKCFGGRVALNPGRLTLLTGANSSGKSSIIYSILGAIQSGEFPFQFSTNGKYVNMGDFREIVNNHEVDKKINLSFSFDATDYNPATSVETEWVQDPVNGLPKLYCLNANSNFFTFSVILNGNKYVVDFNYHSSLDPYADLSASRFQKYGQKLEGGSGDYIEIWHKLIEELKQPVMGNGIFVDRLPVNGNFAYDVNRYALEQICGYVTGLFTAYDDQLNFISSYRHQPERSYLEQSKTKLKVNNNGDGYLDQIIYWETHNDPRLEQLIGVLQQLKLLHGIKSTRRQGGQFEVSVQVKKDGVTSSLSDVGFGISQFLPIIVADLQLPDASTLFVAQPEIHLHPSVQSSFGDYLVNQINTTNKNYIIETHSEYLLNKIRLAIVKGELKEEDVNVVFTDNDDNENVVHKINFTPRGQILNAPKNFFKTYMMDVMEIAINAAD